MKSRTIIALVFGAVLTIFAVTSVGMLFETVGSGVVVVKQGAIDGKLTVWNSPGLYWQGWGDLTEYKLSDQYTFGEKEKQNAQSEPSADVRFNDYGQARASGSLRYQLPSEDPEKIKRIHITYRTQGALEDQLIAKAVNNAVYMTGPLMSSTEAASARRADLLSLAEDQLRYGIYKQRRKDEKVVDPLTKQEKTVMVVELIPCTSGPLCIQGFERQDRSPLDEFGIKVYALTYSKIDFEDAVKKQISRQQEATAAVQEAIAHARRAEQAALTSQKEGEAAIAKTRAEMEVEKTREVVSAEKVKAVALLEASKKKEVAEQDALAAAAEKKATLLRAEGESQAAKMMQQASNFQEKKIDALVEIHKAWAETFKGATLVPSVVMGGVGGASGNATDFMKLITAKAASDLGVTLAPTKQQQ